QERSRSLLSPGGRQEIATRELTALINMRPSRAISRSIIHPAVCARTRCSPARETAYIAGSPPGLPPENQTSSPLGDQTSPAAALQPFERVRFLPSAPTTATA